MKGMGKSTKWDHLFIILVFGGLVIRLLLAPDPGFVQDMDGYVKWADAISEKGFEGLYDRGWADVRVDYPPTYFFLLFLIGKLKATIFPFFGWGLREYVMLLKSPAIISDVLACILLYYFVSTQTSRKKAFFVSALYYLNPAVIFDSAVWGQTDAVPAILAAIAVVSLYKDRLDLSVLFATLAIATKVYYLVLAPLILVGVYKKGGLKMLAFGLVMTLVLLHLLFSPLIYYGSLGKMIYAIFDSASSYPYTTLRAYNIWQVYNIIAHGLEKGSFDFINDTERIGGWAVSYLGLLSLGVLELVVVCFLLRSSRKETLLIAASLIFLGFFMLPTKVHERYMFPTLLFLSLTYYSSRLLTFIYGMLSVSYLLNLGMVFCMFYPGSYCHIFKVFINPLSIISISIINIILFIFLFFHFIRSEVSLN